MAKQAFDNVLELERKAQAPVLDFFKKGFENVLDFERRVQKDVINYFKKAIPELGVPELVPTATVPVPALEDIVLNPVEINGFYLLTGNNYVTFYVTSNNTPRTQISESWTATGITGLSGQLMVSPPFDTNLTMEPRVVKI
jgi:hypothetical protein